MGCRHQLQPRNGTYRRDHGRCRPPRCLTPCNGHLLQANVPDRLRGRVIGGWVFAIGFGWVGHLSMGAIGELIGVRWALGGAGLVVAVTSLLVLAISPLLRRV